LIFMMFWTVAIAIAALAALILALPLMRPETSGFRRGANDAEVYRDQLGEVDREAAGGLIGADDARQARIEIARRLLAASDSASEGASPSLRRRPAIAIALGLCLFLPLAGALVYARTGDPQFPDFPLAERMGSVDPDINILIAQAEQRLAVNPRDGRGWALLAPIYMRRMRADDAANAYRQAIRYSPKDTELYSSLGEALVVANQGVVTKDAASAFMSALAIEPNEPRARFYIALAEDQAGRTDKAVAELEALSKASPPDAPWQVVVAAQIERMQAAKANAAAPGNPDAADVQAASGMNDQDRAQMIRTMVETLDERLRSEPDNFEGWQRLIRSFMVLGEPEKAADALMRGLAAFPPASEKGKTLMAEAKDLGIPAPEANP
jgi:cytochrome c-type biogenesis protein CcmH